MMRRWRITGQRDPSTTDADTEPDPARRTRLQMLARERDLHRSDMKHRYAPQHWTPPPQDRHQAGKPKAKIADNIACLAEWLQQIKDDTSGVQLHRLLSSDVMGQAFWQARERGEQWRAYVLHALDVANGNYTIHRDPREPVAGIPRQTMLFQLCHMEHIKVLTMTEHWRNYIGAYTNAHVSAFLQTAADADPLLFIQQYAPWGDADPAEKLAQYDRWTWHAAQCIGQYLEAQGLYHSAMSPLMPILPPDAQRDPLNAALMHQWAKAFLNLKKRCAPGSLCPCNYIIDMAQTAPVRYPEDTGALILTDVERQHQRELTPPPGALRGTAGPPPASPSLPLDSGPYSVPGPADEENGDDPDLDPNWRGPER